MTEVSKETPYARLKRLRAAAEDRILAMSEYQPVEESLHKKTARLRKLRLKKEAAEMRAAARAAKRLATKAGEPPRS
jgi:hypothetical protein